MSTSASTGQLFAGIDLGTSACKLVLVDSRRRQQLSTSAAYPTQYHADGGCTQQPQDWLRAVGRVFREVPPAAARSIQALAVTAPAHVVVLADGGGEPLSPSLLAWDRRPTTAASDLRSAHGDLIFERTWVTLTAGWCLAQLRWLKPELGAAWSKIACVLPQKDYVRYALTGTAATDPSDAAGTALYDPRRGRWADELLALVDLRSSQLPPIMPALEVAGHVSRSGARRTGLRAGVPVFVGATDTAVELLSLGLRHTGTMIKIASTGTVVRVESTARPDRLLMTYPHAVADHWYRVAATNFAAQARAWTARLLGIDVSSPAGVAAFDRLARRAPAGSHELLFLPFLAGERTPYWDSQLRGAFLGLAARHGPAELARATLEGVAFSLRACRDAVGTDETKAAAFLSGGGLQSQLWRKILVSALGAAATLSTPHGPGVGAAQLARSALKAQGAPPPPAGRRNLVVNPDADWATTYDQLFPLYREAAAAITGISHRLELL
jgi:xylulokinase